MGFSSSDAAGRWSSRPATAAPNTGGTGPPSVVAAANAFVSPSQQDRWTWPLEPSSPGAVLARKLAVRPIDAASSFTANFVSVASSAACKPRRGRRFSSNSPGPASVWTADTSTPRPSRAGTSASTNRSNRPISVRL